jgi:hypothetical protein
MGGPTPPSVVRTGWMTGVSLTHPCSGASLIHPCQDDGGLPDPSVSVIRPRIEPLYKCPTFKKKENGQKKTEMARGRVRT